MTKMRKICANKTFVGLVCAVSLFSCSTSRKTVTRLPEPFIEVIKTEPEAKPKPKSFFETTTASKAVQKGFCTFYKTNGKYYFEIPDSVIGKDILIVNRISKAAAQVRPDHDYAGYGADEIGENIVRFCKGAGNKIFIKKIEYSSSRSTDSSDNGMFRAVANSNLPPIMAAFNVVGYAPDSTALLIDMTDYINDDNELFFFSGKQKRIYNLGDLQYDKSYIQSVASFPQNIEIKTVKTFANANAGMAQTLPYLTYELNTSIVLLPEKLMKARYVDERVGYFGRGYVDFDIPHPQGFNGTWLVTRWRLEPKEEDVAKYLQGELVEPEKPIVFYIDPATPRKWVPYLIDGVNAWQKAFEKAGFKNAIYALEAPLNDPEWSLEDSRHSAIVYKASWVKNASGPNVNDPRTGEILEAHINWYHNITELLHDWYFIQASPSDTAARKMMLSDSLMGKLITFVCTHEVGHTLGLTHNFAASSTVPVDSLRSKKWIDANGICPSIMDYARFNYVAQPEDSLHEAELIPRIGAYDEWAIEWGYRWQPQQRTAEEEKDFLNKWVIRKLKDPALTYTYAGAKCQAEDLGDDPVKAGVYGIKNLKRIMPKLLDWARLPNENYDGISKMQDQLLWQFKTYLSHVSEEIGGRYITPKTVEQQGNILEFVSAERQKAAVNFLLQELFTTPTWLMDRKMYGYTGSGNYIQVLDLQKDMLNQILSPEIFNRLIHTQSQQPANAYTPNQLLTDLETGIWSELKWNKPIDMYRRNLQKAYIARLSALQDAIEKPGRPSDLALIDVLSIIKAHQYQLEKKIAAALKRNRDEDTKYHLADLSDRLKNSLLVNGQYPLQGNSNKAFSSGYEKSDLQDAIPSFEERMQNETGNNCWKMFFDNK